MAHEPESPFAGFLKTVVSTDENGLPVCIVTPRVLTPVRGQVADFLAGLSVAGLFALSISQIANMQNANGWLVLALLIGPFVSFPLCQHFWRGLLRTQKRIVMSQSRIVIGSGPHCKTFDRALGHKWTIPHHRKAREEEAKRQFQAAKAQQRGKFVHPPRYYSDAHVLAFYYLRKPYKAMTVMGYEDAQAVQGRLTDIDEFLDGAARKGDGKAHRPDDQWQDDGGSVPA